MKIRKSEIQKDRRSHRRGRGAIRFAAAGLTATMLFGAVLSGSVFDPGSSVQAAALKSGSQAPIQGQNGQNGQGGQQNSKPSQFKLDVECGYNGNVVPDAYMPVEVTVTNTGKDFVGSVQIIVPGREGAKNIMYQKELSLSSGSSKKVTLYVLANSPSNKINVRLMNSKNKQMHSELIRYTSLSQLVSCNVGVLTDDIGALSYVDGQYIYPHEGYKTGISELTTANFPDDWRGLDLLDVILVSNFSTDQLSKEQIAALTYWIERGGLLIVGTGSTGNKTLSGISTLTGIEGIGEVRTVDTSFGLRNSSPEFREAVQKASTSYSSYGYNGNQSISIADLTEYFASPISVAVTPMGENGSYKLEMPEEMKEDYYLQGISSSNGMDIDWDYLEDLQKYLYGLDETDAEPESEEETNENGSGLIVIDPLGEGSSEEETEEATEDPYGSGDYSDLPGIIYSSGVLTLDSQATYEASFTDERLNSMLYDQTALDDPYNPNYRNGDYSYLYMVLKAAENGAKVTIDAREKQKLMDVLEINHSFGLREMVRRYFGERLSVNITDIRGITDEMLQGETYDENGILNGYYTLGYVTDFGSGKVVTVPFDFTQTPLPGAELSSSLIVSLIQELIGEHLSDYLEEVARKGQGSYYYGYGSTTTPEERRLGEVAEKLKGAGSPAVFLIAALLALYTFMLPIVYSIYKKKKKVINVWIALPVLGVVFTILVYLVCIPVRLTKLTLSEAKVVDVTDGVDTEKIVSSAVMPRIKNYRVGFNGTYDVTLINQENILSGLFGGGDLDYDSYKIGILDSVDQIGYELVGEQVFEQVDFLLQKKDDAGMFTNHSVYNFTGGLSGTLTNDTNRDLSHVAILVEDKVYYVGDWKIGQTIQLDTLQSDTLSRYNWSTQQGTISTKQAAQKVLGKKETNMLFGFLFGSNGAAYKKDQARISLLQDYAFARYARSSYTGAVFGFSESTESYGQAADGKWKEYGQTMVYGDFLLNPDTTYTIRNVKPSALPPANPSSTGYLSQEVSMSDSSKTYLVSYYNDTVDIGYVLAPDDKEAFFVTSSDEITGSGSDPYGFYTYYTEFVGAIWVYNYDTGSKDPFAPGDMIPVGQDSPYSRSGMMQVTFEMDPSVVYSDILIPELFVEKGV